MNAFYPETLRGNDVVPPVVLTDFKLANRSVELGENSPLQIVIDATDELTLRHEEHVFSFTFAALNYVSPEKNHYAYKMEGFDADWTYVDSSHREAKYTNLDAGSYTFSVKASNNDGVWNSEGTSIGITILPPWWETHMVPAEHDASLVGLVLGGFRWRMSSVEAGRRKLETGGRKNKGIAARERKNRSCQQSGPGST